VPDRDIPSNEDIERLLEHRTPIVFPTEHNPLMLSLPRAVLLDSTRQALAQVRAEYARPDITTYDLVVLGDSEQRYVDFLAWLHEQDDEALGFMLSRSAEDATREVPDWDVPDEEGDGEADDLPF